MYIVYECLTYGHRFFSRYNGDKTPTGMRKIELTSSKKRALELIDETNTFLF